MRRTVSRGSTVAIASTIATLTLAACRSDASSPSEGRMAVDGGVEQADSEERTASSAEAVTGEPTVASVAPYDTTWAVTPTGFGPIRVGMGVEEAGQALHGAVKLPVASSGCDSLIPRGWPEGVSFMVVDGRVVRIDVREGQVATTQGVRIGMAEEEIHALYPGQVEVQPHKYTEGQYLIVTPTGPNATRHRIVFETDGEEVEQYRAGLLPAVEWVEGCG